MLKTIVGLFGCCVYIILVKKRSWKEVCQLTYNYAHHWQKVGQYDMRLADLHLHRNHRMIDVPCKHWVFIIQPLCVVRNWIPTFCTLKSQAFPIDSGHEIFRLHCMTFAKKGVAKGQVCITTHTLISELYKWFWSGGLFYFAWGNWWQTTAFQFDRFTYNSFAVARKDNSNSAHSVKENG